MATDPLKPVPAPVPQDPERSCWPLKPVKPVRGVDWFLRMPNGGGTVYARPID
ncbi:hypothetical protein SK854_27765 [Lentzea sp. BCCO 10_0061]|uniref:Uncharacterized protein n=1 Tax=Lentzea sokolovensis TaxID=3095429 RepID=A0ABU4V4Q6_9PSEU|nr:hypothetical protein [Lentzea sp. BCCO 10_0061]MDX8145936.1 hypothetical protein [Lentzea sp. BCCO 10_0061]